ncbi:hypothetical protein WN944_005236 [Citrus x changshan-huyou]|uniref:Uncharacterized protein n=1 Tax=Citrus x changshan-huyou TaxID=2935761 RepID=A0AAP0M855_9ROSI
MELRVMDKEEDERREAAIASSQYLQPNFKVKGVTQDQLSKFQVPSFAPNSSICLHMHSCNFSELENLDEELHRRRLQIKSKSKFHKKPKGSAYGTSRSGGEDLNSMPHGDVDASTTIEDSSVSNLKSHNNDISSSIPHDDVAESLAPKKRQKLHWGLDTKERWERKANMCPFVSWLSVLRVTVVLNFIQPLLRCHIRDD